MTTWFKWGIVLKTGHCLNEILSTYQNTNINFWNMFILQRMEYVSNDSYKIQQNQV